jgi:CRP/FNR family cyclic AMP-dependent transcriptional regulator
MSTEDAHGTTHDAAERLKETTLFGGAAADASALRALASLCRLVHYEQGDEVIKEGEIDDRMFIVKSGTVEVRKRTPHGDPFTVSHLSEDGNSFFGEVGLIENERRTATVLCSTACDMYVITRTQFEGLAEEHPALALVVTREIARMLCQRLRKADEDIITLFGALVDEVAESGGVAD